VGSGALSAPVVRVLPDRSGPDKSFDYLWPHPIDDPAELIGARVRVDLHGRRVGGWVVETVGSDLPAIDSLKTVATMSGLGPTVDLIGLAGWAANRWAGRRSQFLSTASPPRAVRAVGAPRRTGSAPQPNSPAAARLLDAGGGVLRLPPGADQFPAIASALALGPSLVIVPGVDDAAILAARIRRAGVSVAHLPEQWAEARSGVDLTIGTRTAVWASVPDLAAIVVLDEHDERLQAERSPCWHAREVALERGRRLGVPVLLVSPVPTVEAVEGRPLEHPPADRERRGWPRVVIDDRGDVEPWRRSLLGSELIAELRDASRTVVCVMNVTGRARRLACRGCSVVLRCEVCEAALGIADEGGLACPSCGHTRPEVCAVCGSSAFANLRPGIRRIREELEAAAGRGVIAVEGDDPHRSIHAPGSAAVFVGTEAVLHRVTSADTVAFLDIDAELLAPRFRAGAQALALIARGARLAGGSTTGGLLILQTNSPDHPVVRAVAEADPTIALEADRTIRQQLALPPFGALARASGSGVERLISSLPPTVAASPTQDGYVIRAADDDELAAALAAAERPSGVRVLVDPQR
jgi:primosomal protein N' (replication factor Y)